MDLVVIVVAIGFGAFVKGVTGTGLPQIAIPVMAAVIGVERAVIIMAIPGIVSNLWLVRANRDMRHETRDLRVLGTTGVAGAAAGTVVLTTVDGRWLSLVLAIVILGYVAVVTRSPHLSLSPRLTRFTSPPVGLLAGGLQGATGVSGPLLSTYLHGFALAPRAYVLSLSTLFLVFSIVQAVTLAGLGLYTVALVRDSALALLPIAVMLPVGHRLSRLLPADTFRRVILVGLALTATALLYGALTG